jgi:integrase
LPRPSIFPGPKSSAGRATDPAPTAAQYRTQWSDLDLERRRLWVRRQAIWRRKQDCPPGEPPWNLVEPKSRAGKHVVEIPAGLVPLLTAHCRSLNGSNPLNLVFPSRTGTPLYPKNIRRRHYISGLQALGITGVRQHDLRRSFVAIHVEAGTHPKLVQERMGHSSIGLTIDLYGKIAGQMALNEGQGRDSRLSLPRRFRHLSQ